MKSEGLSTKFLRTGGIVIITKQKNVTDKNKGGQKRWSEMVVRQV